MSSYVILLAIAFILIIVIANTVVRNRLMAEARNGLNLQAEAIVEMMKDTRVAIEEPRKLVAFMRNSNVASLVPSNVFLMNASNKIVYKSDELFTDGLIRSIVVQNHPDYIRVVRTIEAEGVELGNLLLITEVRYIENSIRILRRALALGMLIALAIAAIIASFMQRKIVGPIISLKKDIESSKSNPNHQLTPITTGDELQSLYEAYRDMNQSVYAHMDERKRFFQNASHELKTPLMSIQGYAEAIRDGVVEGDEVNDSLDIIISKSQQLKRTVEEIIYLSKLVNEDFEYNVEPTDLCQLIQLVISDQELLAQEKGIQLDLECAKHISAIEIDQRKFESVIENLLSNGLRYAKSIIKIVVIEASDIITIRVMDDGEGLAKGEEEKVFERFYKGVGGNSGIGLAIVAEIVRYHHGTIRAGNHISGGAVFEITLSKG